MTESFDQITTILCRIGKLDGIGPDEDFYNAGFSSINALELLLELETQSGVSIPDDAFISARTVRGLAGMIARLNQEQPA
jgi:acyl carrier protein